MSLTLRAAARVLLRILGYVALVIVTLTLCGSAFYSTMLIGMLLMDAQPKPPAWALPVALSPLVLFAVATFLVKVREEAQRIGGRS